MSFALTMTFDRGVIPEEVTPARRTRFYGPPSFSPIPFNRPEVLPGASVFNFSVDTGFLLDAPPLPPWRRVAEACNGLSASPQKAARHPEVGLSTNQPIHGDVTTPSEQRHR
jgi:hypothetical protein